MTQQQSQLFAHSVSGIRTVSHIHRWVFCSRKSAYALLICVFIINNTRFQPFHFPVFGFQQLFEISRLQHTQNFPVAMPERTFASPSEATTPMTLEPSPFASSADIPSGPAAGYFLPGNPLPYLAPSATHQPELLLLSWMIATLNTIVTDIQNHPLVTDPIPYPSSFTDQQAYRLYLQLRNNLRHLGTVNSDLCRCIRLLQFLPGSPGSPGHYRMDPSAKFPPSATCNYLSTPPLQPLSNPALPSPQHSLITHLAPRQRSRSRDRQIPPSQHHGVTTKPQPPHQPPLPSL